MRLLASQTSPYARKLRVLAAELELDMPLVETAPMEDGAALLAVNPLGKVPVLITDFGEAIFDSPVITSYLLALAPGNALLPPGQDAQHSWHWAARTTEAIADGVLDAVIIKRFNAAQGVTSGEWLDRQRRAIDRSLAVLAERIGGDFDFAMLCTIIACEYLDLRWPEIDWRQQQPKLSAAQARFTERPSLLATRPVA
jgi:glutathione S-transferase